MRRQRAGMQQNSAGAREWHSKSVLCRQSSLSVVDSLAARSKPGTDDCVSLRTLLSGLPSQVFHLLLIDLEPLRLFHVLAQVGNKQSKQIVLFGFEERLADLVFLGSKFRIRGCLFFEQLCD